jgi:processive 1,2-diacylglycerol beta-glucosyltransferase
VLSLGFTDEVPKLMELATLLVSKPGGMTTSEALAKHLPLVIVNPIPGQEAYNARYLLSRGAVVQAGSPETVRQTVRDLLDNPDLLEALRTRNAELAHPNASLDIAKLLMALGDQYAGRTTGYGGVELATASRPNPDAGTGDAAVPPRTGDSTLTPSS